MLPCQGRCREFEPRLPLIKKPHQLVGLFNCVNKGMKRATSWCRDALAVCEEMSITDKVCKVFCKIQAFIAKDKKLLIYDTSMTHKNICGYFCIKNYTQIYL